MTGTFSITTRRRSGSSTSTRRTRSRRSRSAASTSCSTSIPTTRRSRTTRTIRSTTRSRVWRRSSTTARTRSSATPATTGSSAARTATTCSAAGATPAPGRRQPRLDARDDALRPDRQPRELLRARGQLQPGCRRQRRLDRPLRRCRELHRLARDDHRRHPGELRLARAGRDAAPRRGLRARPERRAAPAPPVLQPALRPEREQHARLARPHDLVLRHRLRRHLGTTSSSPTRSRTTCTTRPARRAAGTPTTSRGAVRAAAPAAADPAPAARAAAARAAAATARPPSTAPRTRGRPSSSSTTSASHSAPTRRARPSCRRARVRPTIRCGTASRSASSR